MSSHSLPSFEQFEASLSRLGGASTLDRAIRERFRTLATEVRNVELRREAVGRLIEITPELVPILGLVVGLSQEALKNTLRFRLGSAGWNHLARTRASEVVDLLDDEFNLLARPNLRLSRGCGAVSGIHAGIISILSECGT